jgi:hypothetical protein
MEALGKPFGPLALKYNWKDMVLYSLGVGAGFSEIDNGVFEFGDPPP